MSREGEERWLKLWEPPRGRLSASQERAIRYYAEAVTGRADLRGFAKILESWDWDYYDVLNEVSP